MRTSNKTLSSYDAGQPVIREADGAVLLTREMLAGLWTLRFGPFGCRDEETHGGVLHIEQDRMGGGDGHFLFHGQFALEDDALRASLQVVRHGTRSDYQGLFGTLDPVFRLDFLAGAITPDVLEGRIERDGRTELRVVMRRFEPLSARSLIV